MSAGTTLPLISVLKLRLPPVLRRMNEVVVASVALSVQGGITSITSRWFLLGAAGVCCVYC